MASDFKERMTEMKRLLDEELFLNATIVTEDGGSFRVHKEYVAGWSPHLKREYFSVTVAPSEMLIGGVSKDVMANIINYMYTGQLALSMNTVTEVAKTGRMLMIPYITEFCRKFILANLNDENCVRIYISPEYRFINGIKQEIQPYILRNFQQIFPVSSDYLNLDIDELISILKSDNLNVSGEDFVFWAVMRWVEHIPENRRCFLPDLLRCIRFGLCSPQFFENTVQNHSYVKNNVECEDVAVQVTHMPHFDVNGEGGRLSLDVRHPFLRPRIPAEIIFVMGGWSAGSATNVIETFDVKSGRWFLSLCTDNQTRAYHGMLWHKRYIYILGGFDGSHCFNDMKRYDPVSHVWEEKACMYQQRCYVSVAALDNYIYAMGGFDGNRRNKSCERYDPGSNQWKMMANMNQVRSDASADTLNGLIYIVGGFNGATVLNSAESYDPQTDTWTEIAVMSSPRSGVKVATYNDHLYVIGGFNGQTRLNTVEKYDPGKSRWLPVPEMNSPRSNFAVAVMFDSLYVIGGFNGFTTISQAECFDHRKNAWEQVTDLNLNRSALAACTVKDISNATEYTFLGNSPYMNDNDSDMGNPSVEMAYEEALI